MFVLQRNHSPISDLVVDLQDGTVLLSLLEILTGKEYVSIFFETYLKIFRSTFQGLHFNGLIITYRRF